MSSSNENLRNRLDEIKNERQSQENISVPEGIDMSKIDPFTEEKIKELSQPADIPEDDFPGMDIDVANGTINGEKFVDNEVENDEPVPVETEKLTPKEIAERYKESNSNIIMKEKVETDNTPNPEDPYNPIEEGLSAIEESSRRKAELLQKLAEEDEARRAAAEEEKELKEKGISMSNDVDDIINELNEDAAKKEFDVEDEEDLTVLIQRMEEQKTYANIIPNNEHTGPSDFDIIEDTDYVNNIEEIIKSNGINIVKKNGKAKNAVLNRFVNSGTKVTVPLVNSSMFVTMSGAGIDEIIAMNSMNSDTPTRMEINKLNYVCDHIVNSSVGKLTLGQLLEVVSYYDKDTLYYGLYAGTYPNRSEFMRECGKCGKDYYNVINTRDLLINPEDFEKDENYIKDNVTTLSRLIETSKLGKTYRKVHSNGMIIYVKHPSIKSYLGTLQSIRPETVRLYNRIVEMAYSIDKIGMYDGEGKFIEITDPNEIITTISKIKNPDDKYEIYDMIQEVRPNTLPTFGLKECKCPHCQYLNPAETYDMEDMIFTQAQSAEQMAAMRWAAKNQRKQKELKQKSKTE